MKLWDNERGTQLWSREAKRPQRLAVTDDGKRVVVASSSRIELRSLDTGEVETALEGAADRITGLHIDRDGTNVVFSTLIGSDVLRLNLESGRIGFWITTHERAGASCLAISPDGKVGAYGGTDGTPVLFDAVAGLAFGSAAPARPGD